jgi:uncharacterized protein involved in cysteine biosynthesis
MSFLEVLKATLREITGPEFRSLLWRTLLLAFVLLMVIGGLVAWALLALVVDGAPFRTFVQSYPWVEPILYFFSGAGFLLLMLAIALPILRFVAGRFAGEIATIVERNQENHLPQKQGSQDPALGSFRFALRTWLLNIVLLPLAIIPVAGPAILFAANGYMVGREYHALASNRYRDPPETEARLKRRRFVVWGGGMVLVALSAIPLANLLVPAYGVALMLHLDQRYMGNDTSGKGQSREV